MAEPEPTQRRLLTIAHIITRFERAGSEENTALTMNHQAGQGHRVILMYGAGPSQEMIAQLDSRIELMEISSMVHPIHPFKDVAAFLALRKVLRRLTPDVVHTHQSKAGILGRLAARWAKVPHILHTTHILPFLNVGAFKRAIYLTLEQYVGRFTDAFIHVSPAMQEACTNAGVGRGKIHQVIYSGINLAKFRNADLPDDAEHLVPNFGTPERDLVVLMVAAFEPRKRQLEFIQIFEDVLKHAPQTILLLAGTGSQKQSVQTYIDANQLSNRVKLLGYRTDPERLIAISDICVLASKREGLPRSVIQYVAGGKPIVTAELPGISTLVHEGENGFVIPIDQLKKMADPLIRLLGDQTLREKMSVSSSNINLSSWEAQHMVEQIEGLIQKLAAEA